MKDIGQVLHGGGEFFGREIFSAILSSRKGWMIERKFSCRGEVAKFESSNVVYHVTFELLHIRIFFHILIDRL